MKELGPERFTAMKAQVEATVKRPYTHNPDCPVFTKKQLAEFRPVLFDTMEERVLVIQNQEPPALLRDLTPHSPFLLSLSVDLYSTKAFPT